MCKWKFDIMNEGKMNTVELNFDFELMHVNKFAVKIKKTMFKEH